MRYPLIPDPSLQGEKGVLFFSREAELLLPKPSHTNLSLEPFSFSLRYGLHTNILLIPIRAKGCSKQHPHKPCFLS
jgi:hypothetical protein